jgi:hypothetical protein
MKFVFVCPEKQKVFESASFEIISNKGISLDMKGNKFLDAKVALNEPCPFCGKKHVYHASELSCPFGSPEKKESHKGEHPWEISKEYD